MKMIKGLFKKNTDYVCWDSYKKKVDFLSEFSFQQDVRKQNISS